MTHREHLLAEIIEGFKEIPTATVYDVLDEMGYPLQTLDLAIRPLREDMKIVGPAFTVYGTRVPDKDWKSPAPKLDEHEGLYHSIYSGCAVVVNVEKASEGLGIFGEMTSWRLKQHGAGGIVVDGGIRDRMGLLKIPDWPVFVRYTSHIESNGRYAHVDYQVPITLTGQLQRFVRVSPGDIIVGDCDGVLVVPREICQQVYAESITIWAAEKAAARELAEGIPFDDVYRRYGRA